MMNRVCEIRKCLENELFQAALALALTLPDICGQVEYPGEEQVGKRYKNWLDSYFDNKVLFDPILNQVSGVSFVPLTSKEVYQLRCSFLHSGNDEIQDKKNSCKIDEFHLMSPEKTKGEYGYQYNKKEEPDGNEMDIAEIDIKYLCEMICDAAEKYYQTHKPEDFEDHSITLVV